MARPDSPRTDPRGRLGSVCRCAGGTVRHGGRAARADGVADGRRCGRDDSGRAKFLGWPAESGRELARNNPPARRQQLRAACFDHWLGDARLAGDARAIIRHRVKARYTNSHRPQRTSNGRRVVELVMRRCTVSNRSTSNGLPILFPARSSIVVSITIW